MCVTLLLFAFYDTLLVRTWGFDTAYVTKESPFFFTTVQCWMVLFLGK